MRNQKQKPINRFEMKTSMRKRSRNKQLGANGVQNELQNDVERISYAKQFESNFLAGSWRRVVAWARVRCGVAEEVDGFRHCGIVFRSSTHLSGE